MTAKEQLLGLVRIQKLALEIGRAQQAVEEAPARLAAIEERFRERNAEYVAVKDRHDELDADQRWRSGELTTLEEKRKKLMDDLMQVKNQREYAAMLKEIDTVKAEISDHETAVLKDLEEIDKIQEQLAGWEESIRQERETVERERATVESEVAQARERIAERGREREQAESQLPPELLATLRKLEASRGIFLAKADRGTCLSCFVRIRPQVLQEIKLAAAIHTCGSCKRFLYHEPSLREAGGGDGSEQKGVEAVNGGAV